MRLPVDSRFPHMNGLSRTLLSGLIALTLLRLLMAAFHEISADEAYYYMWSERMALSYYSKGPGIAAAIKTSTTLASWCAHAIDVLPGIELSPRVLAGKTSIGVRLFAPFLALGTSLMLFRLARGMFNERVAAWTVVLVNLTPIFNAGAVIMNIDPLSVFFWVAAMLALWIALHRANPWDWRWPLAGLLIGLGFLCKYTNAIQLLSIVLLFALHRRWRGHFRRPGFYVLLAAFAVCTIPVIAWNAQHGWITVTHLGERGNLDESTGIHIGEFLEYAGAHLGVYSPLFFIGLIWALVRSTRNFFRSRAEGFLIAFSLPIVLLYFLLSFREAGEVNWTAPGMIGAGILLAHHWLIVELPTRRKTRLHHAAIWVAGLISVLMLNTDLLRRPLPTGRDLDELIFAPVRRIAAMAGREDAPTRWEYEADPSKRLLGWKETARVIDGFVRAAQSDLNEPLFLVANRYQLAAVLNFYLPPDLPAIRPDFLFPPVHCLENPLPQNQFSFWPRYDEARENKTSPFIGRTALYITDDPRREGAPTVIRKTFSASEITSVFEIERRGRPLRTVKVFACFGYEPLPL